MSSDIVDNLVHSIQKLAERVRHLETLDLPTSWPTVLLPMLLPNLRAFYTMSSSDQSGNVYDYSNQGRTLTNNGATAFSTEFPYSPITAINLDGANDYLSRADEAGLEFGGSLSIGAWIFFFADGAEQGIVSKWTSAGNQRSYRLVRTATNTIRFDVSGNGTATVSVETTSPVASDKYHHIVATYITGGTLRIYVDGTLVATNTTGIPASLFDSTSALEVGRTDGGSYLRAAVTALWLTSGAIDIYYIKQLYNAGRALYALEYI